MDSLVGCRVPVDAVSISRIILAGALALISTDLWSASAEPETGFGRWTTLSPQPVPELDTRVRFSFFANGELLVHEAVTAEARIFVYSNDGRLQRTFSGAGCPEATALGDTEILCAGGLGPEAGLHRRSAADGAPLGDVAGTPTGFYSMRASPADRTVVAAAVQGTTSVAVVVVQAGGQVLSSWQAPYGGLEGQLGPGLVVNRVFVDRDGGLLFDNNGGVWSLAGQYLRRMIYIGGCSLNVWRGRLFAGSGSASILAASTSELLDSGGANPWNSCTEAFAISAAGTVAALDPSDLSRNLYKPVYRTPGRLLVDTSPPRAQLESFAARTGTSLVDLSYFIVDEDSSTAVVAALAFVNDTDGLNAVYPMRSFAEGSGTRIGPSQPTNVSRSLVWDPVADGVPGPAPRVSVRILAADSALPLDLGFVSLPANVPRNGDPALTITSSPVSQEDYRKLAYWLLARGDSAVALGSDVTEGRVLRGTAGAYAGQVLFSGNSNTITPVGRQFFNERLGMREATPAEVVRAREGSTAGVFESGAPRLQFSERPLLANEIGVEMTQNPDEYFLVPL